MALDRNRRSFGGGAASVTKDLTARIKGIVVAYLGLNLLVSGLASIAAAGFLGIPILALGGLLLAVGLRRVIRGAKRTENEFRTTREKPVKSASFIRTEPETNLKVRPRSMMEKQLEQLECLRNAGLYSREEYEAKKRSIRSRGY